MLFFFVSLAISLLLFRRGLTRWGLGSLLGVVGVLGVVVSGCTAILLWVVAAMGAVAAGGY
jgi:hypothetical protein